MINADSRDAMVCIQWPEKKCILSHYAASINRVALPFRLDEMVILVRRKQKAARCEAITPTIISKLLYSAFDCCVSDKVNEVSKE